MIIERKTIGSITNEETEKFELNNDGGHLFAVLSELYSKPVESTIREISTNCMDAHIMNNCVDTPFIIKLPNPEKNLLTLCFRDFGPGLTHEQVRKIYKVYGVSTKTNDNNATGCLGLGSKSPFSITSTFYVKSYFNGKCSQYTCSMSNAGIPDISKTPIVFDSDEENGLEVIIPFYKEVDFKTILPKILKYFKTKPRVVIQEGELQQDTPIKIDWIQHKAEEELINITDTIQINKNLLDPETLIEEVTSYSHKLYSVENEVIQLQIYYPIDINQIKDTITRFNKLFTDMNNQIIPKFKIDSTVIKFIDILLKIGVKFQAEPGKIAFSPSRETIKYTDLTLMYMIRELIKAAKILEKVIHTKFNNIDTYPKAFQTMFLNSGKFSKIYNYFGLEKHPRLFAYNEVFEHSKLNSNLLRVPQEISSGMVFDNYSKSIHPNDFIIDNCLKNHSAYLQTCNGVFNYVNIFGQGNKYISSGRKVFILTEVDSFFEATIETVIRKNVCQLVDNMISCFDELYAYLLKADLVTITELTDLKTSKSIIKAIEPFLLKKVDGFNKPTEILDESNLEPKYRTMTFDNIMNTLHSYSTYTGITSMVYKTKLTKENINMLKLDLIEDKDKEINIGSDKTIDVLPKCTDEAIRSLALLSIYLSMVNQGFRANISGSVLANRINTLDKLEAEDRQTLNVFPDIMDYKLQDLSANYDNFRLRRSFYSAKLPSLAITFNKLMNFREKLSDKAFAAKIDNSSFVFENLVNEFRSFLTKPKVNNYSILNGFTLIKAKDQVGAEFFIDCVIMHTYMKFFPNEFKNTINYLKEVDFSERIKKELTKFNIPLEFIKKIDKVVTAVPLASSGRSKSTFKAKDTGSPIYYFDFEVDEELMKKLKFQTYVLYRVFNEHAVNIFDCLNKLNLRSHENKIFFSKQSELFIKYQEDIFIITSEFTTDVKQLLKGLNFEPTWENYNNVISNLRLMNKYVSQMRTFLPRSYRLEYYDDKLLTNFTHSGNGKDETSEGVIIDGVYYLIKDKNVSIDDKGLSYYYLNSSSFTVDYERFQELQQKLFDNNKIVMFDDNLKISFGINAFPEKYNFEVLRKALNDSTIRAYKKKYLNTTAIKEIKQMLQKTFPDYKFLKLDDKLETKFTKRSFSIYPFLFELCNNLELGDLYDIIWTEKNLGNTTLNSDYPLFPQYQSGIFSYLVRQNIYQFLQKRPELEKVVSEATKTPSTMKNMGRILFFENHKVFKPHYKNISKIIRLFGGKKLAEIYERVGKETIDYYAKFRTLAIKYIPEFPTNSIEAYSSKDSIIEHTDNFRSFVHDTIKFITTLSRDFPELKCAINRPLPRHLNPLLKGKFLNKGFFKILDSQSGKFEKILYGDEVNYSEIKEDFDSLFRLDQKNKVSGYKSVDEFISLVTQRKVKITIHDKINARTKSKGNSCKTNSHLKISNTLEKIA